MIGTRRRRIGTAVATATLLVSGMTLTTSPADAGILCSVGVCGHVRNSNHSNRNLLISCSSGLHWLRPGNWSNCHDANGYYARRGMRTYRLYSDGWKRQSIGRHGISDGQWLRIKVRS